MTSELHHIGYVVGDLRAGVERFAAATGAGPFYAMEHIEFDQVTYRGAEAVYDHSSAFGRWGSIIVELTQVHEARPAGLAGALVRAGRGVGHAAWLAESLEDETARLQAAGLEPFHTGRTGPASAVWFDGGPLFGHPIEVLQRCDELLEFYASIGRAAQGWAGSDPYRPISGPPS
ncbi:MAG: VOC family protein [Solirubrobacterales bacterium]|nr:VOC family protein [Solirubrobacterales bacterium]